MILLDHVCGVWINVVPKMESVGKKLFRLAQEKPNAWKRLVPILLL
jgi:hypothetical protein